MADQPATAATETTTWRVYAVAHVSGGAVMQHKPYPTLGDAEDALQECLDDGADCFIVERIVGPWQRVR